MLNFKYRSLKKEFLDDDDIPFNDIQQNLIELNVINTFLGGHKITLEGIQHFISPSTTFLHIVEIGSGGGDNLYVIQKYLNKKNIPCKLTGIDLKQECIDYAKEQTKDIEFICSDYKLVTFEKKPDIIFNSLFCHHFKNEALSEMLYWMKYNSRQGFFINDLQRNYMAYYSIKVLTSIFSNSYLVKNDAPLSVARGFVRKDWETIFNQSHIDKYQIKWKWAFRYLICCNS